VSEIHFGARIAAIDAAAHDGMHAPDVIDPTVDFLAELAGNGAALEFRDRHRTDSDSASRSGNLGLRSRPVT